MNGHPPSGLSILVRAACVVALCVALGAPSLVRADASARERQLFANPESIAKELASGELQPDEVPNPHWRREGCPACHTGDPQKGELRHKDPSTLCNSCHDTALVAAYIHAVGMRPPDAFMKRMPENFRQAIARHGNVVTCLTCHDLPMQCNKKRERERGLNPRFFRGGPYPTRTALCFNCHEPENYQRFNPHNQISDEGVLDGERCFICHSARPDRQKARSILDVQFNVVEELSQLCTGCHPWRMHPGGGWARYKPLSRLMGPNHLVVPSASVRKNIARIEKKGEQIMPLDPLTGKVTCATCHNPHERGVQFQAKADIGADGVRRLRRTTGEICFNCHDK